MANLRTLFWLAFALIAATAITLQRDTAFAFSGPHAAAKIALWLAFAAFGAYTLWVSAREDLLRSLRSIATLHWGRQVGLDLYIGFTLALCVIGLHSGWMVALAWLLPIYVYGNIATLLWLALNVDSLLGRFT